MHDKDDWIGHAEAVALTAAPTDDFVLEVRAIESISGNPETLTMPREWFDYI